MRLSLSLLIGACSAAPVADSAITDSDPGTVDSPTGDTDTDTDSDTDISTTDPCAATAGLVGDPLSAAIAAQIADQDCRNYFDATTFMFVELDNVNSEVECVYTGRMTSVFNAKPDAADMNTEHSWPQSLGAEDMPAKCDIHHLYPTDADANSRRGNSPFGVVTGSVDWQEGGSKLGAGAGGIVFEPRDSHKGNAARSMVYFAHRYGHEIEPGVLALYKQWHNLDPVDDTEVARSVAIGEEQVLANPFVMCPDLVDRVD